MADESLLLEGGRDMDMLADVSMALGDVMSPVPSLGMKLGVGRYDSDVERNGEESGMDRTSDVEESVEVDDGQDDDDEDGDDEKTIMPPKLRPKEEIRLPSPPSSPSISYSSSSIPPPSSPLEGPATPSPSLPKSPNTTSKSTPGTGSKTKSKIKIGAQTEIVIVSSFAFVVGNPLIWGL